MEDLSKYSTEELEAMLQDSSQPAQPAQTQAPQATQEQASDMPDLSQYSTEDLERMIGEQGTAAGRIEQMFNAGTDRRDNINPLEEAAKGAGRAAKAIGGAFVGLGSGAVRLAGTPVRALTGWDGLHRVADAIDSGYEDWGSEALASELPDDDWGRVLGVFGEKMAGTAGTLGAMAAGGGLAKLGAAGKFGAASKAVGTAGAALQKSLPLIFGNDAAVRTYDTAKENGSGTARALGLASVNGAIHYFGFKAFENQSLNKMLGMPQEMTATMPGWANAAREGGAKTFTELASGVRNGMYKYILAERAKGALKAGGIMGLQNFLSSVPTQMAEGAGVGDVDWGRAVSEGLGGVEEGALMEALMGGAAALKTPKAARKFIADTYFRNGYKLPNGQHVPGLLHSEEGRAFVMKQNPDMQARILDIIDHGGKVTKGELNAACLPPDMTEAELREFKKDWRKDLASEWDRAAEPEALGDGEELEGNEPVIPREQQMRNRAKVNEMRDHDQRVAEAEEANRARAEEQAADDVAVAAEEANWAEANAKADAERVAEQAGAEQLAREEAYPQPVSEQPAAPEQAPVQESTEPPVAERSNRLRRNLKPNFRHQGENQQQPQQEKSNETGNVPVEAQPEPAVQDAGRVGQQQAPQAAEGLVEGEAPRGEVPAAGEVAEARPADAKPVAPAPAATQEQKPVEPKPVSKSDRGGQKLTGEVSAARDTPTSKPLSEMTNDELLSAITAIDADGKMEPDAYKKAIKPYKDEIARRNATGRGAKPDEANDVQITENVSKRTMDDAFGDFIDENGKPKTISQLIDNGWRVEKTQTGAASRYRLVKDGVDGFHDLSSKKIKGRMRPGNYAWNIEAATKYSDSAEPPKTAPASEQSAEGTTTTPPNGAEPVQGAELAAGGATGKKPVNLYTENEEVSRAYSDMVDAHYNQKNFSGSDIAINRILRNSYEYAKEKLKGLLKNASTEDLLETFNGTVGGRPPTARKGWLDFFGDDMSSFGSMLKSELESRGYKYNSKTGDMDAPDAPDAPTRGNKLRRSKKGKKLEAQEPKADVAPKADATPAAPAMQEATPEATTTTAPTTADQTQPTSKFRDKNGGMKKTLRGAVERIASAIGNRTGKGAITPEEADAIVNGIAESPEAKHNRTRQFFTPLVTDAEWQNSLGVDAESAKNLRDAVARAKTDSEMAHFFVQVDKAVKKAKDGKLSPKDAVPLNGKISEGLEKAEREGRHEAAKRLREALEVIRPVVDAVSQKDVDKFNRSAKGKKLHTQLDGSDRRRGSRGKTVSLDTKDGTVDVGVDGRTLEDVADEISDSSHDRRTLKPGESYGKGFTKESDNDTTGTEGTRQGSTGKGGRRGGNRVLRIDEIDGDDVAVSLLDSTGRDRGVQQKMNREQWETLARAGKSLNDADPSNPQVGDNIMMSRWNAESPADRDAKFAADADYQRWLKSRKANDAEPLRQRYEMEQAKVLGDAYQNAVRGVDFEYVDRDYDPAIDGGGDERKSVGGIYTGSAADYDKPSLLKVGTGEGTQVYGWGLYGSTERGVAEGYARQGRNLNVAAGDAEYEMDGKSLDRTNNVIDSALTYLASERMNTQKAIEEINRAIDGFKKQLEDTNERLEWDKNNFRLQMDAESLPKRISHLNEVKGFIERDGGKIRQVFPSENIYEQTFFTDRAPGDESHLLKWYEPVTREQMDWIESRLKAEGIGNVNMPFLKGELPNPDNPSGGSANAKLKNGRTVYDHLANKLGSPQAASEFLARAGIDGVKYPVDSYGGKGVKDGDKVGWNYVSFRDDNIRVDHKWEDGNLRYLRDRDTGTVLGIFDRGTGKLTLFRGANWKTLNHELGGHATMRLAEQEAERGNRALLDKINESIDNAPQWLKDEVKSRYPDADEATLRDEIWAALRERPSEAMQKYVKTLQGRKWYNRAWDAIKTAWRGILSRMGFNRADLSGIDKMTPDEFNEFLDKAMIGGKTLGRLESQGGDGIGNKLRKAFGGGLARVLPGNIGRYREAEQMEADGASREDIWRKTGWWKGKDGKWRVELPDIKISNEKAEWLRNHARVYPDEPVSLESLIEAPELFRVYPSLKKIKVYASADRDIYGSQILDRIYLNRDLRVDKYRTVLAHEIQHVIQDFENFAKGGNLEDAKRLVEQRHPLLIKARDELVAIAKKSGYEDWARGLSPEERRSISNPFSMASERIPLLASYINGGYRERPDYAKKMPEVNRMITKLRKAYNAYKVAMVDAEAKDQSRNTTPTKIYNAFAGEVEARNVESRLEMSPEERAATPPWATEDVPESEQIVRTGDGGGASESRSGRQSSVRMARGPVTPGPDVRIMDDEVKWLDRQGERFVDSTHNLRKVQSEVGYRDRSDPKSVGVEEVMDPKTGFVDWRKSSDIHKAIVKSNGFVQKNEHILQIRRDKATREMAKMKGLSEDEKRELVDNYLIALHAEERNRTIADRRGDTYNDDYAEGAGRSAKWARDFIANDPNVQKYKAELDRIADIVHEAVVEDLRLRHENGLLSDDEYNFYSKKWKHYVPLRTDVTEGSPEGGAFNTSTATFNRSEYRTAKGRGADNIASSPFAFAFVQAHDGIGKSARNIIGNVTANFIDMTEAKGLNSTKVEVVAKDGSKSTKTEYRIAEVVPADVVKRGGTKFAATFADGTTAEIGSDMRLASHQDNLVLFKRPEPVIGKDGKPTGETAARLYVAKFTEGKNGRGTAVAKAITGKNMVEVPFWVQPFSKATHFLSRMNTSASPSFLTSNIFNDRNEAWRAMSARFGVLDGAKMAAKVWKYRYADGKDLKNWLENGELRPGSDVADFINGGAAIKGGNIAQGFSGETSSLKDNLARQERKARSWWERFKRVGRFENVREIASSVGDVVQSANELEELGTRYGVYHAVLDELVAKGVPREVAKAEAVTFCRGATTDFNVRGTLAPVIGSFYMFYNANVQGTRRNIQSLTDKRGVQTFATLAGVASAMTVLRYWLGNDEDREKGGGRNAKNALEYQKQSAMGIPIPSGRELSILKMRGVDALIPYAATKFTEAALYDDVSAMEALADSLKAVGGEALGVLGGNGVGNKSQISQTLAPSLADPFVQWATGTDWQGERRVKQLMDKTVPQSYNARHGTSDVFKWIAETVNDISGGNQYRKGVVDMAPEDVQLIVETLAGGLGRDITGAINTFSNVKEVAKGGSSERLFGRMPVVKSLVREYPDSTSRYFDALDEYNADKAEFKKTTELGRRAEMKKEHPYLTAQKGRVDALIEQVQELTHRERGEVKVGQKWVPMKTELPEARKEAFRKRRLRLQAEVLRILGK